MRPRYRITADDRDITAALADFRIRLEITDEAGMTADRLSLEIADPEQRLALPQPGAVLRVSLGFDERFLSDMGAWTVDELEVSGPPNIIRITARAADMSSELRSPKSRSWHQISLGDLVETIAGEHRLGARVAKTFASELIEHIDQSHESDLHMLTRMARARNAIAKPANRLLLFVERANGVSVSGQALTPFKLRPSEVTRWRITLPGRTKANAVTARYYAVYQEVPVQQLTVGRGSPTVLLKETYPNEALARQAARSNQKEAREKGGALFFTLPGDPLLRAETPIRLEDFREGIPVDWIAERVIHRVDNSGYRVEVNGVLPGSRKS